MSAETVVAINDEGAGKSDRSKGQAFAIDFIFLDAEESRTHELIVNHQADVEPPVTMMLYTLCPTSRLCSSVLKNADGICLV